MVQVIPVSYTHLDVYKRQVGLSAGVTPVLSVPSKLAVIVTMFIGRVGPVSLAMAITIRRHAAGAVLPEGKLIVG